MTVKDLIAAEKSESEENAKDCDYIVAEDTEASADDMFCTAAGAASFRPSAGKKSKLRELLNKVDRA